MRYASGLAAQRDVIRAQLEQTAMRSELIGLEAERRQLQGKLNALVGMPSSEMLATPEHIRTIPAPERMRFDVLEQRARASNPLLRTEESQIRAAEKSRELAYKNRYPDFSVGVSPIQYGKSIREWELMVEVNIPCSRTPGARRSGSASHVGCRPLAPRSPPTSCWPTCMKTSRVWGGAAR